MKLHRNCFSLPTLQVAMTVMPQSKIQWIALSSSLEGPGSNLCPGTLYEYHPCCLLFEWDVKLVAEERERTQTKEHRVVSKLHHLIIASASGLWSL